MIIFKRSWVCFLLLVITNPGCAKPKDIHIYLHGAGKDDETRKEPYKTEKSEPGASPKNRNGSYLEGCLQHYPPGCCYPDNPPACCFSKGPKKENKEDDATKYGYRKQTYETANSEPGDSSRNKSGSWLEACLQNLTRDCCQQK